MSELITAHSFCPGAGPKAEEEATRFAINSGIGIIKLQIMKQLREGTPISYRLLGDWTVTSVDHAAGTTERPGVEVTVTNTVDIREWTA